MITNIPCWCSEPSQPPLIPSSAKLPKEASAPLEAAEVINNGDQLLPTFITELYNMDQLIATHLLTWKAGWMWLANLTHANFSQKSRQIKIMFFPGLEEEEKLQTSAAGKFAKSEAWVCVNLIQEKQL